MKKNITNPFEEQNIDETDDELIAFALKGNQRKLNKLMLRHQPWIYNIAIKMVADQQDAEDVTQEIMIKLLTKLSTYKPEKSSFRTWLYRIVANHVINMKKRKYEYLIHEMDDYFAIIDSLPNDESFSHPESQVLVEECYVRCMTGMLLCFKRKQRFVFILGTVFNVNDTVGSEILDISKENFRQVLSRSKKKLYDFMNQKCGLLNTNNSCKCSSKLKALIDTGMIDPDIVTTSSKSICKISEVIQKQYGGFEQLFHTEITELFQGHPFYEPPEISNWVSEMAGRNLKKTL